MRPGQCSAFELKIIAVICMTLDHAAVVFGNVLSFAVKLPMYLLGGVTFVVMAYLLTEGFSKTRDVKRYLLRLLVWGLIAQIPYTWALGIWRLNVLFTLLAALVILVADKYMKNRASFYLLLVAMTVVTYRYFDWGGFGILLVFFFSRITNKKTRVILPVALLSAVRITMTAFSVVTAATGTANWEWVLLRIAFFVGACGAIPLLLRYNGQRGRLLKHFFYAYYPGHLLLLGGLRLLLSALQSP